MATRRIQDLENIEEVLPDSIIPVGESTKTKSMLVSQLKNWLSSFFISKTADEEFSGIKTMIGQRLRFGKTNLGSFKEIEAISENGGVRLGVLRFQNGTDGISREAVLNIVDNENQNKGGLKVRISTTGVVQTVAITPQNISNDDSIATTKWARENTLNAINTLLQGQEGSIVLNNGVTIQWGYAATSETEIVFPTPFNTTNYTVVANPYYNASGNISTIEYTTTGCKLVKSRSDFSVKWFAIGR